MQIETELLVRLQSVDLEVKGIQETKEKGPARLQEMEKKAQSKGEEVAVMVEKQTELKKKKKDQETELEDSIVQLKKCQSKLMNVKTNREYQALLKEIEEIKKANRKREDEIVSQMEELERIESESKAKEEELALIKEEMEVEKRNVESILSQYDKELRELQKKRDAMARDVPEDLLKKYDFLRSKRNGLAIVGVENEVCLGCHMNIPPQLFNELLREEALKVCPSCQRIIYVYFTPEAANED